MANLGTYRSKYIENQVVEVLSIATNAVDNSAVVVFHLKGQYTSWYTMPIKQFNATFEKLESKRRKIKSLYIANFA